uniref:Uncharacterized protein n=1 Tax=Anopheles quadriannulatus TaxID=34691 RepID=A0A182XTI2_ANOQN
MLESLQHFACVLFSLLSNLFFLFCGPHRFDSPKDY